MPLDFNCFFPQISKEVNCIVRRYNAIELWKKIDCSASNIHEGNAELLMFFEVCQPYIKGQMDSPFVAASLAYYALMSGYSELEINPTKNKIPIISSDTLDEVVSDIKRMGPLGAVGLVRKKIYNQPEHKYLYELVEDYNKTNKKNRNKEINAMYFAYMVLEEQEKENAKTEGKYLV
jgi:hypothetical protein